MDVKCDAGVISLHMKVHRHLRATGSRQSIKVKNVTGLHGVAITYGFSHDQSFTRTHACMNARTQRSDLLLSANLVSSHWHTCCEAICK